MLVVFIFNDRASGTEVELAALAAAAISTLPFAVGVPWKAVSFPLLAPHAAKAISSGTVAAVAAIRRADNLDQIVSVPVIPRLNPTRPVFGLCSFIVYFPGSIAIARSTTR
jgi:hypothetical protein